MVKRECIYERKLLVNNNLIFEELYVTASKKEKTVLSDAISDLKPRKAKTERNSTLSKIW